MRRTHLLLSGMSLAAFCSAVTIGCASSSSTGVVTSPTSPIDASVRSTPTPTKAVLGLTCEEFVKKLALDSALSERSRSSSHHWFDASAIKNEREYLTAARAARCVLPEATLKQYAEDAALDYLAGGPLPADLQVELLPAAEVWVLQSDAVGEYQAVVRMQQIALAYDAARRASRTESPINWEAIGAEADRNP